MKKHTKSSLLFLSGGMIGLLQSVQAETPVKPNVLLIMCDDLISYDGIYGGHPQAITPNLDVLKAQSVNFTNAHSIAPVSAPCRSALFTGIYPHVSQNYGFDNWQNNPVLSNSKTIMEMLKENGYNVYGTGKLLHHNKKSVYTKFGLDNYAGPLAYDGVNAAYHPSVPAAYAKIGPLDGTFASLADIPVVPANGTAPGYAGWFDIQSKKPFRYVNDEDRDLMRDEEHAVWASDIISQLEKGAIGNGNPFFLGVGLSKPHTALVAPQKYFDMFPMDSIRLPVVKENDASDCYMFENLPLSKGYLHFAALKEAFPDNLEHGLRRYLQAYLASLAFADDIIGDVVKALDSSIFANNTIVIFVSDHGYDFGQKEYFFKNSLWETSTSVPFLVRYPFNINAAGKEVNQPISLIDIYPTLVDVCSLQGDTKKNSSGAALSGHSIKPFLENVSATEWSGPTAALSIVGGGGGALLPAMQNYSVRSKDWRYIRYANGKEELYNKNNDVHEWDNLAYNPDFVAAKKSMRDELCIFVPSLNDTLPQGLNERTYHKANITTFIHGDFLNVEVNGLTPSENTRIKLFAMDGDELDSTAISNQYGQLKSVFPVGMLPKGVYFVAVNSHLRQECVKVLL
ncbi:MAG: sulfatase-like hydrolase/transferase [Bacteroidales bacterium]|jgi:arylsulfatase A-like enzyme